MSANYGYLYSSILVIFINITKEVESKFVSFKYENIIHICSTLNIFHIFTHFYMEIYIFTYFWNLKFLKLHKNPQSVYQSIWKTSFVLVPFTYHEILALYVYTSGWTTPYNLKILKLTLVTPELRKFHSKNS